MSEVSAKRALTKSGLDRRKQHPSLKADRNVAWNTALNGNGTWLQRKRKLHLTDVFTPNMDSLSQVFPHTKPALLCKYCLPLKWFMAKRGWGPHSNWEPVEGVDSMIPNNSPNTLQPLGTKGAADSSNLVNTLRKPLTSVTDNRSTVQVLRWTFIYDKSIFSAALYSLKIKQCDVLDSFLTFCLIIVSMIKITDQNHFF